MSEAERLADLLERDPSEWGGLSLGWKAAAELRRLSDEIEKVQKDSERYRWLRDDGGAGQFAAGKSLRFSDEYPNLEEVDWFFGSDLDATIDAAMKGTP